MNIDQSEGREVLQEGDGAVLRNLGVTGLILLVFMVCLGVSLMVFL